jgi:Holliday junction resolvase-like predicted endonuclease
MMIQTQEREEAPMTFEQIREMFQEIGRKQEETAQQIKENARMIGGMANSEGDAAEELFATSLASKMTFAGQRYDAIDFKVKRKVRDLRGEFDIVLYNGTAVAIIEVKQKACQADLEKLATKQVSNFRALFPLYKDHAIYLGIGSMSFDDRVLNKAHELGIGILRQKGDTIEADTGSVRAY